MFKTIVVYKKVVELYSSFKIRLNDVTLRFLLSSEKQRCSTNFGSPFQNEQVKKGGS